MRQLREQGIRSVRLWEHELRHENVEAAMRRIESATQEPKPGPLRSGDTLDMAQHSEPTGMIEGVIPATPLEPYLSRVQADLATLKAQGTALLLIIRTSTPK